MSFVDPVEESRQRFRRAMETGVVSNPDEVAQDRREATARGVSVPALRDARAQRPLPPLVNFQAMEQNTPRLVEFLSEPANAAVAHDDLGPLGAVENVLRGIGGRAVNLAADSFDAFTTYTDKPLDALRGFYDRVGIPQYDILGARIVDGRLNIPRQDVQAEIAAVGGVREQRLVDRGQAVTLGYEAGTTWEEVKARPLESIIPFAVEQGLVSIPDMALVVANLPTYVMARTGGIAEQRADANGVEQATVGDLVAALPAATASALLERLGTRGIIGLDDAVRGGARGILPAAGRAAVKEGLTEAAQGAIEYAGASIGTETGFDPAVALDQALAGAAAGTPFGGTVRAVTGGVEVAVTRSREQQQGAAQAEQDATVFENLTQIAEASKLRERAPETFQQFVDQAAEGSPVEDIYVDAQTFAQSLNDAGVDINAVVEQIPSLAEQLPAALASGGDVRISAGEYASRIAATEAGPALLDHLRADPFGMSRAQASEFMSTQGEQLKAEVEKAVAQGAADESFRASADTVRSNLADELNRAGRFTADVNNAYASLVSNFYAVTAMKLGITPEQMAERYPLRVSSELPSSAGRETMNQDDGTVELVHYSDQAGMAMSDPSRWGATRATPNSERMRRNAGAPGRTYFGVSGVYGGEGGAGIAGRKNVYTTRLPRERLYDFDADPLNLKPTEGNAFERATAYEQAIQAAGYAGYRSDATVPGAVALFEPVPVVEAGSETLKGAPERDRPNLAARRTAEAYMAESGLRYEPPTEYAKVDKARAARIAQAFEDMKHDPADPEVAASYRAMIDETLAQWDAIKATGLKIEFIKDADPYAASPRMAIEDVRDNNHLWVYPTDSGFGSSEADISGNPLLEMTGESVDGVGLRANDVFRIVHDYFGHIKEGNGFRAAGEENAWQSHAAMFTPLARRAMTTETRGQNSWVNYGPHGEKNRTASASETVYADQKIGLLPEWVSEEGFLGGPNTGERRGALAQGPRLKTDSAEFKAWFGDSKVVDENGDPLVVYRGQHGGTGDVETRLPSIAFGSSEAASLYAASPNNRADTAEAPTVFPVYLSIQNPIVNDPLDPYIDLSVLVDAVGFDTTAELARKNAARIEQTGAWEEGFAAEFEDVADVIARAPGRLGELPLDAYVVLDDPAMVAALRAAGFDGAIHVGNGVTAEEVEYRVFAPEQIKSVNNRGTFDANDPRILFQPDRGQIAFGGDITQSPSVISLLRTADLSTFLHETGHFFLEVTAHIANSEDAPADVRQDMDTVLSWFAPDLSLAQWNAMDLEQRRPYHEQFARGFEAYLFEGRAPSPLMRDLFRRFSAWLKNVYKTLTSLNVTLTDDVRNVFGRMVASTEEIQAAEQARAFAPLFDTKPEGLTEDEWKRYQELGVDATAEAIEQLESRSARDMRWASGAKDRYVKQLQAEANDQRKAVRAEVTAEVMSEPVNRAREYLRRGVGPDGEPVEGARKLSLPAQREAYGEDGQWTALRRGGKYGEVAEDGVHPDVVAEMFGYESGAALIDDMVTGEIAADKIKGLTDQRMLERYGDLSDPQAVERAANEAVANDARAKFIASEMAALDKAVGKRSILNEAARDFAASVVNRLELKRLRPAQYLAAQGRAARDAEKALKKDDLVAAATAKRNQLINLHTARAVQNAQKDVEKTTRLFTRIISAQDDRISKTRNMDLVNAARAILTAYGIGRVKNDPQSYMDALKAYDPTLYADLEPFVSGARGDAKPLGSVTYEQFQAVRDTVGQLWTMSRRIRQIEIDGKLMDKAVAVEALNARLEEIGLPDNSAGLTRAVTDKEHTVRDLLGVRAALRRVESWARGVDGADQGPFRKFIWNPISTAADAYRTDSGAYIRRFRELLDTVRDDLKPRQIAAPEIGYTFGGKAELYHALLHTGNGSNKSKLLLGRLWGRRSADGLVDDNRWTAMLDRFHAEGVLTKRDWDFVQSVWNLLEETKPGAQRAHRAVYGRYFDEIAADPVQTPFGEYRGGYVPALTDAFLVQDAALRAEQEAVEGGDSAMFPAASNGFTKSRVEDYTRELALDLRLLPMHIDKVLKFTHLGPPVRDVARLLKDRGFSRTLQSFDPTAQTDLLLPWLQRAAKQIVETPSKGRAGKAADRFFSAIRSRVGMQLMFANVVNTAQQVTGFSNVLLRVKAAHVGEALWRYTRNPKGVSDAATTLSPFLTNRMNTDIFEARQEITRLTKLDPNAKDQAVDFVKRHAYFMQSALQNVMDVVSWSAAFDQATARGDTQIEAVRFADSVIRETQGTMAPEDISRFETGTPFVRMFTQFAGYFNMMANLNATEVQHVARGVGVRKGAGRLFYVYLMGFAIPALLGDAIAKALRGGWEDEDGDGYLDDLLTWFFSSQAKFALAAVPVVGQAANAAIGAFTDAPYDDRISMSPAVSVLESAAGVPAELYQSIVEGESFNRADVRDALNLLGVLTGTPTGILGKPVGYAVGVAQDDIEPTGPLDAARGAVTGAPSPESRQ